MLSGLFSGKKESSSIWSLVEDLDDLHNLHEKSKETPILLFKHSTRCSISSMMLNKFERSYQVGAAFIPYFLDLIAHRAISNEIAAKYEVLHQSPQAILIYKGEARYDESHNGIDFEEIDRIAKEIR